MRRPSVVFDVRSVPVVVPLLLALGVALFKMLGVLDLATPAGGARLPAGSAALFWSALLRFALSALAMGDASTRPVSKIEENKIGVVMAKILVWRPGCWRLLNREAKATGGQLEIGNNQHVIIGVQAGLDGFDTWNIAIAIGLRKNAQTVVQHKVRVA